MVDLDSRSAASASLRRGKMITVVEEPLIFACSTTTIAMLAQDMMYSYQLLQLESFRSAAWGENTFIKRSTRRSGLNTRTIEYLDFGKHHQAVHSFCHAAFNERVIVFEEYRGAMREFKDENLGHKKGACIIGQPGIGIYTTY